MVGKMKYWFGTIGLLILFSLSPKICLGVNYSTLELIPRLNQWSDYIQSGSTVTVSTAAFIINMFGSPDEQPNANFHVQESTVSGDFHIKGRVDLTTTTPVMKLETTGDNNNTRVTRTDTNGKVTFFNTVNEPGAVGNAVSFDGSPEHIIITDNVSIASGTMVAWVKFDNDGDGESTVMGMSSADLNQYWRMVEQSNGFALYYRTGASDFEIKGTNVAGILKNTWYHVVVTLDAETLDITIYINAVDALLTPIASSGSPSGAVNEPFAVGRAGAHNSRYLTGDVDEARVYNDVKDQTWVTADYNSGMGTFGSATETGLVAGWHFDEGTGTDADNFEGTAGFDGTLTNMEEADWVTGKVLTVGADKEVAILTNEDGVGSAEEGITIFGNGQGEGQLDYADLHFEIAGTEVGVIPSGGDLDWAQNISLDNTKRLEFDTDGDTYATAAADDQKEEFAGGTKVYSHDASTITTYVPLITNGLAIATTKQTESFTASDKFTVYYCSATLATTFKATLPAASTMPDRLLLFKKVDKSTEVITIDADSSELIDDATSQTLTIPFQGYSIISDSIQWFIH